MSQAKELIKTTCEQLGYTQKQLAQRMKVGETTLSQWARGVNTLPDWAESYMKDLVEFEAIKKREFDLKNSLQAILEDKK